ncbi:YeeE/YedE family protein [Erythrobacter sp. LQ02-29]|uniref:YeeE/YedE family protein n=1 Tax=Erythrobacter sp. LQ02-29 TaxID=2920384 RepID=UPI001F4EB05F|nr:YeeE/YedE thiosulfate transporter family protein [Erythrobacter sp. LQ02-29]MCP9221627.1 YeeE/YedE family protein [Erythrobacter sp. LQ02-29]
MSLLGFPDAAPLAGLVGGVLIGLAAALMLLGNGRIAGVSGIAARAAGLGGSGRGRSEAWLFILGLPLGALIGGWATGGLPSHFPAPLPLAIAGLIVGVGTRLGSGCTSGHGVCGMSRLAPRSLVATAIFMATGIATVATMNALDWRVLG